MRVVHCKRDPFTHYIGRPGPFGNPYSHLPSERTAAIFYARNREDAVASYEEYARQHPALWKLIEGFAGRCGAGMLVFPAPVPR